MFLLILFFVASCASDQPCLDYESVDISGVKSSEDGSIEQNGVVFPPKYVYSKKVDGETRTFGCLCQSKKCLRKCCPLGHVIAGRNCSELPEKDVLLNNGLNTFYKSKLMQNVDLKNNKVFDLLYGKACEKMFLEDNNWYMQQVNII